MRPPACPRRRSSCHGTDQRPGTAGTMQAGFPLPCQVRRGRSLQERLRMAPDLYGFSAQHQL